MRYKAVVIEDDRAIADLITTLLESEGIGVQTASDGESGVELVREVDPHFVVLDHELPGVNGQEACRRIRAFTDAYVVMLTARSDEIDKVTSFNVGVDDYITKPFSSRELVSRLHAMSRRPRAAQAEDPDSGMTLDERTHSVSCHGVTVVLTPTEFTLVTQLAAHAPEPVRRADLTKVLWGGSSGAHVLDVHISNLRKKLKKEGINPDCIQTHRAGTLRLMPFQLVT